LAMDPPLFPDPFITLRFNDEEKGNIDRPSLYQDVIAYARQLIPAAKSIPAHDIFIQVRVPGEGYVSLDDAVWPDIYEWINEVNIAIRRDAPTRHQARESPASFAEEQADMPAEFAPAKRKRGRPRKEFDDTIHPGMMTLESHIRVVQTFLKDNPREPWVVPPAHLHESILAYISLPEHLRDDRRLSVTPTQRRWIKQRKTPAKKVLDMNIGRTPINDQAAALHAALCRAHGRTHRCGDLTLYAIRSVHLLAPNRAFVRSWCDACPGCKATYSQR